MKIQQSLRWDVTPAEARAIQMEWRSRVVRENRLGDVHLVAGVDVGLPNGMARAAVVVFSFPALAVVEQTVATVPITFPYVPGLLTFREAPAILAACAQLSHEPDLIIMDGHGIAHPRRFGITSFLGVALDRPTIGCAKSRLIGEPREPLSEEAGAWVYLYDEDEIIGAVVRSKTGVNPIYVSIGHKVDLETCIHYVLACCRGYRLPETSRKAHQAASLGARR